MPVQMTPTEFETVVLDWLRRAATAENQTIEAQHLATVPGIGGEYEIDVLVTFSRFVGARFIVLVECKHQRRPVERQDIMVLDAKVRDIGAHKGMLFSTSGFQSGALKYADAHALATVAVVNGTWLYETKGRAVSQLNRRRGDISTHLSASECRKRKRACRAKQFENDRPDAIVRWLRQQYSDGAVDATDINHREK